MSAPHAPKSIADLYKEAWFYSALLLAFFLGYWGFRYGYVDGFIINKAFAAVSAMLLGIVLLMGPFARCFPHYATELVQRKYLGIVAFYYALGHGIISAFFIPNSWSLSALLWAQFNSFFFGLAGLFLLVMLFILGHDRRLMVWLGGKNWFTAHSWGLRVTVLAVFLHVVLVKYGAWLQWFRSLRPRAGVAHWELPPIGLWIATFFLVAFLIRLAEKISEPAARIAFWVGGIVWILFCAGTVIWGILQRVG